MLEAITDFWKPAKKIQSQEQVRPENIIVGSTIGFGFVPQASLSGQRLQVTAINTYQFGAEALTSMVLSKSEAEAPVASVIFAESDGEHYLAISRRITGEERGKLFDAEALSSILENPEVSHLPCKESAPEYKGWLVASYKREIQGMKGRIFRGDFRRKSLPDANAAQEFNYMLLVSDSNEQAIEIEKYTDGRVEVYATVYRRMSDIGEVEYMPVVPVIVSPSPVIDSAKPVMVESKPVPKVESKPEPKVETSADVIEEAKTSPIKLQELNPAQLVTATVPVLETKDKAEEPAKVETPIKAQPRLAIGNSDVTIAPAALQPVLPAIALVQEEKPASITETNINGVKTDMNAYAETDLKPKLTAVVPNQPSVEARAEVRAVAPNQTGLEGEAIECELRVANKIIDEAIRNEMRLADVVRRIIELPVAYPESVQIPMTLSDEDYALLAIRYSIPASDRNAIKRRIIEDLNDFSGGKKKAAAA